MSADVGASAKDSPLPIRVAVVGAGPAGFYSVLDLFAREDLNAEVDLYDRLPAPFGLVRYGVAPDHLRIRSVTKVFTRGVEEAGDRFRYFGNVEIGKDVTIDELLSHYHAVVLAFGAQDDRELGIPGEDLPQSYSAREFVAWYNGHPDFCDMEFDLTGERAMVIGIGNVAVDVARILARTQDELTETDMSDEALAHLAKSNIREIDVVARRGPLQAKTTHTELIELARMADADLVVEERDLELDPISQRLLEEEAVPRQQLRNLFIMQQEALREPRPGRRFVRLRFYLSPVEILGEGRVTGVKLRRNTLEEREGGYLGVVPTDETETVDCSALFRSIGYRVSVLPGVPYRSDWSIIPNEAGQVVTHPEREPVAGLFVAGWAKRGPSGVVGTNKPDAVETVSTLVDAYHAGKLATPTTDDIADLLRERGVRFVTYSDWQKLNQLEIEAGEAIERPRCRFLHVEDMLRALDES